MSQKLCRIIHRSVLDLQITGLPKAGIIVISVQVSKRLSSESPRGSHWGRANRNRCLKCCFSLKTQIFASSLKLQPRTFPENRFDCLSFWVRLTVFFWKQVVPQDGDDTHFPWMCVLSVLHLFRIIRQVLFKFYQLKDSISYYAVTDLSQPFSLSKGAHFDLSPLLGYSFCEKLPLLHFDWNWTISLKFMGVMGAKTYRKEKYCSLISLVSLGRQEKKKDEKGQ